MDAVNASISESLEEYDFFNELHPAKLTDLISEPVLELLLHGFAGKEGYPLSIVEKRDGRYFRIPNQEIRSTWADYCKYIRNTKEGNQFCCRCDERVASDIIQNNRTDYKTYICDAGLLDIAIPLVFHGRVLAVFFYGQKRVRGLDDSLLEHAEKLVKLFPWLTIDELLARIELIPESTSEEIEESIEKSFSIIAQIQNIAEQNFKQKCYEEENVNLLLFESKLTQCFSNEADVSLEELRPQLIDAIKIAEQFLGLSFAACFLNGIKQLSQYNLIVTVPKTTFLVGEISIPASFIRKMILTKDKIAQVDLSMHPELAKILSQSFGVSPHRNLYALLQELYGNAFFLTFFSLRESKDFKEIEQLERNREKLQILGQKILTYINQAVFNETRNNFLRESGHLLRGPMNAIVGESHYLQFKLSDLTQEHIEESLKKIQCAVTMLEKHVTSLSLIAIDDETNTDQKLRKHSILKIVRKIIRLFRDLARNRGISFSLKTSMEENEDTFFFEWEKMEILLTNIFDNAIKYSYSNRDIQVNVSRQAERCTILIVNEGVGFDSEESEKLFQKYYRSRRKDYKRYIAGTGIGLPVARDIAKSHGGDITIYSNDIYRKRDGDFLWSEVTTEIAIRMDLQASE